MCQSYCAKTISLIALSITCAGVASAMCPSLKCCPVIHLSSSGPAETYQTDRLGVYSLLDPAAYKVNGRPVYGHRDGGGDDGRHEVDYLYYWQFDNGHNWIVSEDYNQHRHGIESPDMRGEFNEMLPCNFTCMEHINSRRRPFSVWTRLHRLGGFQRDTFFRAECWDDEKAQSCCDHIRVRSLGVTEQYQPGRLGTYTFESYRHGRKVYKKDGCVDVARTHYLYFYDWGPNSGSNWMIGLNPTTNSRGVESLNLEEQRPVGDEEPAAAVGSERDKYLNICVTDSLRMGPFRTWDRLGGRWLTDPLLRVECFNPDLKCCPVVELVTRTGNLGGPGAKMHAEKLGAYARWTYKNGRPVYRHVRNKEVYLHYNDWGLNLGSNWMFSVGGYNSSQGVIVSPNLENFAMNECASDAGKAGPFIVYTEEFGWAEDKDLRIECFS